MKRLRNLLAIVLPALLLTACPSEREVDAMMADLTERRSEAIKTIDANKFDLDGLLTANDYFFNFAERVHLLLVEPESVKGIQSLIKKKKAKIFCESFVVPLEKWQVIEAYCKSGEFYRCSPEIKEYENILKKMADLLGKEAKAAMAKEASCSI